MFDFYHWLYPPTDSLGAVGDFTSQCSPDIPSSSACEDRVDMMHQGVISVPPPGQLINGCKVGTLQPADNFPNHTPVVPSVLTPIGPSVKGRVFSFTGRVGPEPALIDGLRVDWSAPPDNARVLVSPSETAAFHEATGWIVTKANGRLAGALPQSQNIVFAHPETVKRVELEMRDNNSGTKTQFGVDQIGLIVNLLPMIISSSSDTPPALQPHAGAACSALGSNSSSELLLQILSKLTVYQLLPDSANLVLSVRSDVTMVDACCLFLPAGGEDVTADTANTNGVQAVEVLDSPATNVSADLAKTSSQKLFAFAKCMRSDDDTRSAMFASAVELEARECISRSPSDSLTVAGDFLCVSDVFFFISGGYWEKQPEMSVSQWIAMKRSDAWLCVDRVCVGSSTSLSYDSLEPWSRFCIETVLLTRAVLNLCPSGIGQSTAANRLCSSSSMNMSLYTLLGHRKSRPNLTDDASTSTDEGSEVPQLSSATVSPSFVSGGSTLVAVTTLMDRFWQDTLPLLVSSEKGVVGVFAYTGLEQLMASVAMNSVEKVLDPLFSLEIGFEDSTIAQLAINNLNTVPVLHHSTASLAETMDVLRDSPTALLLSSDESFAGMVTRGDLLRIIANRMDLLTPEYSDGSSEEMLDLPSTKLMDELGKLMGGGTKAVVHVDPTAIGGSITRSGSPCYVASPLSTATYSVMSVGEFPCALSLLLQNCLLHGGLVVVLDGTKKPKGLITVRDLWSFAMNWAIGSRK